MTIWSVFLNPVTYEYIAASVFGDEGNINDAKDSVTL